MQKRARAVGEDMRRLGGRLGQQERELVASEPRDRVVQAHRCEQLLGDPPQRTVADLMAEGVVQLLEAVDIDQCERERSFVA